MSTTVKTAHTATTAGAAQGFEPMVKNVTPQVADQTTGGIPQNILVAHQTASLQGLRPGIPPASTQSQPTSAENPLSNPVVHRVLHRTLDPKAPSSGQTTTGAGAGDPIRIHPDGVAGVIGRAGIWCMGGALAGSPGGLEGMGIGCAGGAAASLASDLWTAIYDSGDSGSPVQEDPIAPIDIPPSPEDPLPDQHTAPDDPPPSPTDGPDDPSTSPTDGPDDPSTCDGSDSGSGPRLDD